MVGNSVSQQRETKKKPTRLRKRFSGILETNKLLKVALYPSKEVFELVRTSIYLRQRKNSRKREEGAKDSDSEFGTAIYNTLLDGKPRISQYMLAKAFNEWFFEHDQILQENVSEEAEKPSWERDKEMTFFVALTKHQRIAIQQVVDLFEKGLITNELAQDQLASVLVHIADNHKLAFFAYGQPTLVEMMDRLVETSNLSSFIKGRLDGAARDMEYWEERDKREITARTE